MERILKLVITGDEVQKNRSRAGIQGEANATDLVISFDESWDGYAKTVTWFDALEQNPVKRILTADLLEDLANDTQTYRTSIPGEPLAVAGKCTLIIDGYIDGKRARSIPVTLLVAEAPVVDNAGEPTDPTPSQAEQLQAQIDTLLTDISAQAKIAQDSAARAAESQVEAGRSESAAADSEANAKASQTAAADSASTAAIAQQKAQEARQAIEDMLVEAITLTTGQSATVSKTLVDGVVKLVFGLPEGPAGPTGPMGASIQSIQRTGGTGSPGTTDTYTITMTDGSVSTFQVYNGANGTGVGDFLSDGSVPMTGNLQMGGKRVTGLGAPVEDTDAVRKMDLASSGVRVVIGAEAPTSGPALWFNTGAAAAAAQEAAMLSLNDDEDTGSVIAEVEGQQYAVENATIDTEPTAPGVYDFTIL